MTIAMTALVARVVLAGAGLLMYGVAEGKAAELGRLTFACAVLSLLMGLH